MELPIGARQTSEVKPVFLERRLGAAVLPVHYVTSVLGTGILILPGIALEMAGPAR